MSSESTIVLGKQEYSMRCEMVSQAQLSFHPKNPRVYNVLNANDEESTQIEIEKHMKSMEHVKQLKLSIEENGGVIEPLFVREGDWVVLEGNSRLAAYRILCAKDPIKWGKVRCNVLPSNISEEAIFALLGQVHIVGRKDWAPFEQAYYLYRRHIETKLPFASMGSELGIKKGKVELMVRVIQFMIENNDLKESHWSHYEEYLKNASLKKYRETSDKIDDRVVHIIKNESVQATDFRKLADIVKVNDRQAKSVMNQFISGKMNIDQGYDLLKDAGKFGSAIKNLKNFRDTVGKKDFEKELASSDALKDEARFLIAKIVKQLEKIQKNLKNA